MYNIYIYGDLKLYNYNNFLVFCSSICNQELCNTNNNSVYSILILFSYPNCIDETIDLIEYLSNNNININDFKINLSKYFKIDNNIFGYIFKYIKIINKFENENLNF